MMPDNDRNHDHDTNEVCARGCPSWIEPVTNSNAVGVRYYSSPSEDHARSGFALRDVTDEVAALRAELSEARERAFQHVAQAKKLRANLERMRDVWNRVAEPEQELDTAEAELDAVRPIVEAAMNHRPICAHLYAQRGNATCAQLRSATPCAACNFNAAVDEYIANQEASNE